MKSNNLLRRNLDQKNYEKEIMKKVIQFILPGFLLAASLNVKAQNWANGGSALTANGVLGTTTNFSFLFKTNNRERGRLTNNGLWGFGTATPDSKVHINSAAGRIPLRVEVNGSTKPFIRNQFFLKHNY